jgi:hypothetical protein
VAVALELGGGIQIWQPFRVEMNRTKNLVKEGGGSRIIYAPFTAAGNLMGPLRYMIYHSRHVTLLALASFTAAGALGCPLR